MLKNLPKFSWILLVLLSGCDKPADGQQQITLSPEPATIDYNGTFTMSWAATAVNYCIASGDWSGNIKKSGSKTIGPLKRDSLFILNCHYSDKVISESVSVKVRAPQIPRVKLSASPLSIGFGESTTLSWSSQHVENCRAEGGWSGAKETHGSVKMAGLESDREYALICDGPAGDISDNVSINVVEAGINVPRVNLTARPEMTSYNGSIVLSWDNPGADICRASGDWFGSKSRSGSETIAQLTKDSRFIMTCTIAGGGGGEGIDAVEVTVGQPPPPKVSLRASPDKVATNGSITLRWSSSHADSCIATGDWSGTKSISGSLTVNGLKKESLFRLQCSGVGGVGRDSITINITDN